MKRPRSKTSRLLPRPFGSLFSALPTAGLLKDLELPSTPSQYLFSSFHFLLFAFFWCFPPLMSWEDTSVGGDEDFGVKSTMSRNKRVAEAAQSYGLEKENKSRREVKPKLAIKRASASELACLFCGAELVYWSFICQLRKCINREFFSCI